ncbi:Aste57867_20396 [Aphanomyces stellatus]|uniref:Aste57867_20396 protein n=1 Tax=Aphanomyces stellatus TaxID=120398 RepID=A0A485LGW0_9STRA|nr:hypothetical protein As57867_020330 [Aphanomyces stellatus]VFT97082.1 Aste57867_20396 [Aphanomyces stellatus]
MLTQSYRDESTETESSDDSSSDDGGGGHLRDGMSVSRSGRRLRPVQNILGGNKGEEQMLRLAMDRSAKEVSYTEVQPLPPAPVYYPTVDEFANPMKYIDSIAKEGAQYGVVKIVPPKGWSPPQMIDFNNDTTVFETKLQKVHRLQEGKSYKDGRDHTLKSYRTSADTAKDAWFAKKGIDGATWSSRDYEREYWKIVETSYEPLEVEYANDLDVGHIGSGFPRIPREKRIDDEYEHVDFDSPSYYEHTAWNLNNMPSARGSLLRHIDAQINGVNVPWMYFGMFMASFCWHAEDNYMYSVNYHHAGAKKHWYGIPSTSCEQFERVWKSNVPERFKKKPDLHFHLVTMVGPTLLRQNNVSVFSLVQEPGDIVITFPQGYHCGFSEGFNCNEAVNFTLPDWIPFARVCNDLYRTFNRLSVFSHDRLMYVLAMRNLSMDCTVAGTQLLLAEMATIVQEEIKLRDELVRSGIQSVIAMGKREIILTDDEMGYDDQRQCAVCKHSLFFSGVACRCSQTKVACLRHAARLCKCHASKKVFLQWYTIPEMFGAIQHLEQRLQYLEKKDEKPVIVAHSPPMKRAKFLHSHNNQEPPLMTKVEPESCRSTLERKNSLTGGFSLSHILG